MTTTNTAPTHPPLSFTVEGTPGPQGSKNAFAVKKGGRYTGRVAVVESSAKVGPWREQVAWAARQCHQGTITGPVSVAIVFYLPRPRGHYGTGRNAGSLRASAPALPAVKPDADKLARSTLDALTTARVYTDDAVVVDLAVKKRYADGRPPGAAIEVVAVDVTNTPEPIMGQIEP
ncbi:RusA family crossover junction endodeoxyribonuclease [Pseudarthrobacter sp. P1]|uniref:RusA family crossover junction endodeoxyribonuclease n=1 Tax=Pseudarthrobacter sp. P1 TaxID=3418418 RepID=UPI003CFB91C5